MAIAAAAQPPATTPVRPRGPRAAFPQRPPADPAVVERGKALYSVNCAFCHGSDGRGGEGGPVLLRSQLVLNDQNGELLVPIVQNGRDAMPKFDLNKAQISEIAAFIHSFKVGGYDVSRMTPPSIVVGDAKAGEAFFNSRCGSCHSATGDLKGIGAKFTDPKQLQQTWLIPSGGRGGFGGGAPQPRTNVPPTTVTVTLPSGQTVQGRLTRIDDFFVTLTDNDGAQHTFTRNGETPRVEIHDPLQPHKDLLRTYADKDIHNLTAYLVTLK
jgi:cytochrome c oxidase cbb3-type subunit III